MIGFLKGSVFLPVFGCFFSGTMLNKATITIPFLKMSCIIFIFWSLFWGLNGGDKFANGDMEPILEDWATKGVMIDADGQIVYRLQPMEIVGWYGVNRNNKMKDFFSRLYLPGWMAETSLYTIAAIELLLGTGYLILFIWSLLPAIAITKIPRVLQCFNLFTDFCFKSSFILFLLFCSGDILFGERVELWEHCTFLILVLVTYNMWLASARAEQVRIAKSG